MVDFFSIWLTKNNLIFYRSSMMPCLSFTTVTVSSSDSALYD